MAAHGAGLNTRECGIASSCIMAAPAARAETATLASPGRASPKGGGHYSPAGGRPRLEDKSQQLVLCPWVRAGAPLGGRSPMRTHPQEAAGTPPQALQPVPETCA